MKYPLCFDVGYVDSALRIKNCLKSTSATKIANMKKYGRFCYEGKPSCAIAKSTLFAVSKDEWDTKEDSGKAMKNELYILQGTCRAEATSTSEKIKPIAFS